MSRVFASWALFLDFDGTLVDIAATPDAVSVPLSLQPLLTRLGAELNGAIAILTGRSIREIDAYLRPLKLPVAGGHGAEQRSAPFWAIQRTAPPLDGVVQKRIFSLQSLHPGIRIEPKYSSIAVHYRQAEEARPDVESALREIIAGQPDHLILCRGRKVIEVTPKDISKGTALATFMRSPAFCGRIPMMIGDDASDQSAFDMAHRLGGAFKRVAGEHFSLTDAELQSPAHVRAWLTSLIDASVK